MLGDPRQHTRPDLIVLMECEYVIRPTDSFQDTMRSARLTLDAPTNPQKGCQSSPGLGGWPLAHDVTAKTPPT